MALLFSTAALPTGARPTGLAAGSQCRCVARTITIPLQRLDRSRADGAVGRAPSRRRRLPPVTAALAPLARARGHLESASAAAAAWRARGAAWAATGPGMRALSLAAALAAAAAIAWGANLGAAGLVDDTEPLFAEAARRMASGSGDWLTPTFNLLLRLDKPPLAYWLMAASMAVFGQHPWAARLPSALCAACLAAGLASTVMRFGVGRPGAPAPAGESESIETAAWQRWLAAAVAACAVVLCPFSLVWGSAALSDMALASTVSGSILAFFWGYAAPDPGTAARHYGLSACLCGLSLLAKGPVGPALIALTAGVFLAATGDLSRGPRAINAELGSPLCRGVAIVSVVAGPWYAAMTLVHGARFWRTFIGYHHLERFATGVNHHGGRVMGYGLAAVTLGCFPWSLAAPPALASILCGPGGLGRWAAAPRSSRLPLLAVSWLVATAGLFGLSASQLPSYYLPLLPPVALLAAHHFSHTGAGAGAVQSLLPGWEGEQDMQAHGPRGLAAAVVPASLALAFAGAATVFAVLPRALVGSPDAFTAAIGASIAAIGPIPWTLTAGLPAAAAAVACGACGVTRLRSPPIPPPAPPLALPAAPAMHTPAPIISQSELRPTPAVEAMDSSPAPAADGNGWVTYRFGGGGVAPAPVVPLVVLVPSPALPPPTPTPMVTAVSWPRKLASLVVAWDLPACLIAMVAFATLGFTPALRAADAARQLPVRTLTAAAVARQRPPSRQGRDILAWAGPPMPSAVWYARQPVAFFPSAREAAVVTHTEAAPGVRSVLLIAEGNTLAAARRAGASLGPSLAAEGGYELVRITPRR